MGKLTLGKLLAAQLGGKLLDNHSIYNIALALTEFKSPAYYETLRAVRAIAYQRVLELPPEVPVVLTNAHMSDSDWGNECWDAVIDLAQARGVPLFIVVMECSPEENSCRIQGLDREEKRKPRDPTMFRGNIEGRPLLDRGGEQLLRLDLTCLAAKDAAARIATWIKEKAALEQHRTRPFRYPDLYGGGSPVCLYWMRQFACLD